MKHERRIVYLASFLFTISIALITYVNSSVLGIYLNKDKVALVYIIGSVLSVLGLLEMPRILTRLGNRRLSLFLSITLVFSFLALALSHSKYTVLLSFILYFATANFMIMSLDIFIEDLSKNTSIGRLRGSYLAIVSLGWVVAQAISGSVIARSSFSGVYLFSATIMVLVSAIFILFLGKFKDPKYKRVSVIDTISFFLENKDISKIYLINFILRFFFSWMIIYSPIYLNEYLLLDWTQIGLIFTIMLLPFAILVSPLGKLSDKIGEKKMLSWGLVISAIFTATIPLLYTPTVFTLALVFFMTRVGAATIEIMSESYFFKSIHKDNADAISFYRNTTPLSFIVASLTAIPVLFFIPSFAYIFLVLSAILLLGLLLSLRLKERI